MKNYKNILLIIVLLVFSFIGGVTAATTILASSVSYDGTTVESALDNLFTKAKYGNAVASNILSNKTALVQGKEVTGSMTNNGAISQTLTPTTSVQIYTVPTGYHDGSGKVTVQKMVQKELASFSYSRSGIQSYSDGEQSFTMPADGIVYYDAVGMNYGSGSATYNIYKNDTLVYGLTTDTTMAYRGSAFGENRSFTAVEGDVIKVNSSSSGNSSASVSARIIYFSS